MTLAGGRGLENLDGLPRSATSALGRSAVAILSALSLMSRGTELAYKGFKETSEGQGPPRSSFREGPVRLSLSWLDEDP